jgi:hypothetical protein
VLEHKKIYKEYKEHWVTAQTERSTKLAEREDREANIILDRIKRMLGDDVDVETDKYCFKFTFNGMHVRFINQGTRLVVDTHTFTDDHEEMEMLADDHFLASDESDKIKEHFQYKSFCLDGDTASTINELTRRLNPKPVTKEDYDSFKETLQNIDPLQGLI